MKLDRKVLYEIDGGDREKQKSLEVEVEPGRDRDLRPGGRMSTATRVPETWELTGDDAREDAPRDRAHAPVVDAFTRLRYADGFSHARSLAFAVALVLVQGLIALVGFAAAFGNLEVSRTIVDTIQTAMPGLAGELLTDAVKQANEVGSRRPLPPAPARPRGDADHRGDRARPDRARAQPDLRRRARPADAREVRPRVRFSP